MHGSARARVAAFAAAEEPIEWDVLRDEWTYLLLAWIRQRVSAGSEALKLVDAVYSHLNFPEVMGAFVSFLNPEKDEEQLLLDWGRYLRNCEARYRR